MSYKALRNAPLHVLLQVSNINAGPAVEGGHQEISGAQDRYISAFTTLTAPEQGDKEAADWNSTWDEGEQSKFPLALS